MKKLALLPLVALLIVGLAYGQETTENELPRLDDGNTTAAAPAAANSVFIICCDAKPGQILVLDSTGKWLSTVRDAEIKFTIGETVPTVKCTMWSGPFKPTNPEVRNWTLAQLKSVTATEFQQMVDSLQSDPEAIRRRVTQPAGTGE